MSVPSTTNDLDQIGAIIGFVEHDGRKPQDPGIIKDGYSLASKEWRFLAAALLVMVLCTLGSTLVETVAFSIGMRVSMPDLLWNSGV